MSTTFLSGLGVALVTPFDQSKEVDFAGLGKILAHLRDHVDYLVLFGTTGESVTLSQSEKSAILEFVINNNPTNLPLVYGLGGSNTLGLKDELVSASFEGISAILSVSPAYNKPSQSGIKEHYTMLADHSPLPIILYNVPGRTSSNLTSTTTLALSKHSMICGIKEASGDIEQIIRIASGREPDFLLISGDDLLTLPLMSIGASGLISVLANAYPRQFKQMLSNYKSGNLTEASSLLYSWAPLNALMYEEGSPTGIKQVLSELGVCSNQVRLPLVAASADLAERIKENMIPEKD